MWSRCRATHSSCSLKSLTQVTRVWSCHSGEQAEDRRVFSHSIRRIGPLSDALSDLPVSRILINGFDVDRLKDKPDSPGAGLLEDTVTFHGPASGSYREATPAVYKRAMLGTFFLTLFPYTFWVCEGRAFKYNTCSWLIRSMPEAGAHFSCHPLLMTSSFCLDLSWR